MLAVTISTVIFNLAYAVIMGVLVTTLVTYMSSKQND